MRLLCTALVFFVALGLVACNDCDSCDGGDAQKTDSPKTDVEKTDAEKTAAPAGAEAAEGLQGATGDAAAATGGEEAACVCVMGLAGDPVWCKKCDKGYIDGEPAHCQGCVKKAQKKASEAAAAE